MVIERSEIKKLLELSKLYTSVLEEFDRLNDKGSTFNDDLICMEHEITPTQMRNYIGVIKNETNVFVPTTPEEKLYTNIFGYPKYGSWPTDLEFTIPYVMQNFLNDVDNWILKEIYFHDKKYADVVESDKVIDSNGELSFTHGCRSALKVRGLENAALEKLRAPEPARIIEFGMDYPKKASEARENLSSSRFYTDISTMISKSCDLVSLIAAVKTLLDNLEQKDQLTDEDLAHLDFSGVGDIQIIKDYEVIPPKKAPGRPKATMSQSDEDKSAFGHVAIPKTPNTNKK